MPASNSLMQLAPTPDSFKPGQSGNPTGKRKGTANRVTIEAREAAALIVDSPEYRAALKTVSSPGKRRTWRLSCGRIAKASP